MCACVCEYHQNLLFARATFACDARYINGIVVSEWQPKKKGLEKEREEVKI